MILDGDTHRIRRKLLEAGFCEVSSNSSEITQEGFEVYERDGDIIILYRSSMIISDDTKTAMLAAYAARLGEMFSERIVTLHGRHDLCPSVLGMHVHFE